MSSTNTKVREITLTAILAAIILLMAFTPLGYLRIGPMSITLLVIPVVIGGMTLGPVRGGFLGAVFGATSLAQCFMGDMTGAAMFAANAAGTVIACFVPRILIGVVSGLLFPVLMRTFRRSAAAFIGTAVAGTLTNTIFFVALVVAFFKDSVLGGGSFWAIFVTFFSINVAVELAVGIVVSAALSAVLDRFVLHAPRYRAAGQNI